MHTACIVLIGMPGSGKSTIAQALAKRCGYAWVDTDTIIEQTHQQTLQELIAAHGVEQFHRLEERACLSVNPQHYHDGLVVATGGSVVYMPSAMQHLSAIGTVVHLDVDIDTLLGRLGSLEQRGVTIAPGQTFEDLFNERTVLYEHYRHVHILAGDAAPDEVVQDIVEQLELDL